VAPAVKLGSGETKDVLYVATMANVVYALDALHPEAPPLWSRRLEPPIAIPDPAVILDNDQISHEVGILGTPVLAPDLGALYVVAATKSADVYAHRVYELSLSSGEVLASAACKHAGFDSAWHAQRAALTLTSDALYVPFGGYKAASSTSGWIFRFDLELNQLDAVPLKGGGAGGISMSGQGPAVDAGGALLFSTDTAVDLDTSAAMPSALLQLAPPTWQPSAVFVPSSPNESSNNELGSAGPLLIPGSNSVILSGQRRSFVLERSSATRLRQELRTNGSMLCDSASESCASIPSSPIFWPGSGSSPQGRVFTWAPSDLLRAFAFDAASQRLDCDDGSTSCAGSYVSTAHDSVDAFGQRPASAAQLSVSSDGNREGSGVVWAAQPFTNDDLRSPDGILRAFDAEDLSLSWSTENAGTPLGPLAPGATPTVSGGRVFMGTADGVSNKHIFWDDETAGTPAITGFGDRALVVAWSVTSAENPGFQLKWSADGSSLNQTSSVADSLKFFEPALASDGAHIYLAWTASSGFVKVARSNEPSFAHLDFMQQREPGVEPAPLGYQPTTAPALAYGNERLFLAFNQDDEIVVVSSRDGATFDTAKEVVLPGFYSSSPPALAYLNDRLYLISTDGQRQMNLFISTDDGAHFSAPLPLPMSSFGHPALMTFDTRETPSPDLHLAWTDVTTDGPTWGRIKIAAAPDSDVGAFARVHQLASDQATFSINSAWFKGSWYIAWMGVLEAPHPNVARYTGGELVSYGLKAP
ncbi:MAG TPA: PQQ-binding-like beta-propeller repeat protein, partial [Polyangiaceae bacterium]|nr:PQQ-binding-like beta-propeller repeat protein [Polyangiaceae bacterium]